MCKNCYNGPNPDKTLSIKVLLGMPVRLVAAIPCTVFLSFCALVLAVIIPNDPASGQIVLQIKDVWLWAVYGNKKVWGTR